MPKLGKQPNVSKRTQQELFCKKKLDWADRIENGEVWKDRRVSWSSGLGTSPSVLKSHHWLPLILQDRASQILPDVAGAHDLRRRSTKQPGLALPSQARSSLFWRAVKRISDAGIVRCGCECRHLNGHVRGTELLDDAGSPMLPIRPAPVAAVIIFVCGAGERPGIIHRSRIVAAEEPWKPTATTWVHNAIRDGREGTRRHRSCHAAGDERLSECLHDLISPSDRAVSRHAPRVCYFLGAFARSVVSRLRPACKRLRSSRFTWCELRVWPAQRGAGQRPDHTFLGVGTAKNSRPIREPSCQTRLQLLMARSWSIVRSNWSGTAALAGTRRHAPVRDTLRTAQSMPFGAPGKLILPVRKVRYRSVFLVSCIAAARSALFRDPTTIGLL